MANDGRALFAFALDPLSLEENVPGGWPIRDSPTMQDRQRLPLSGIPLERHNGASKVPHRELLDSSGEHEDADWSEVGRQEEADTCLEASGRVNHTDPHSTQSLYEDDSSLPEARPQSLNRPACVYSDRSARYGLSNAPDSGMPGSTETAGSFQQDSAIESSHTIGLSEFKDFPPSRSSLAQEPSYPQDHSYAGPPSQSSTSQSPNNFQDSRSTNVSTMRLPPSPLTSTTHSSLSRSAANMQDRNQRQVSHAQQPSYPLNSTHQAAQAHELFRAAQASFAHRSDRPAEVATVPDQRAPPLDERPHAEHLHEPSHSFSPQEQLAESSVLTLSGSSRYKFLTVNGKSANNRISESRLKTSKFSDDIIGVYPWLERLPFHKDPAIWPEYKRAMRERREAQKKARLKTSNFSDDILQVYPWLDKLPFNKKAEYQKEKHQSRQAEQRTLNKRSSFSPDILQVYPWLARLPIRRKPLSVLEHIEAEERLSEQKFASGTLATTSVQSGAQHPIALIETRTSNFEEVVHEPYAPMSDLPQLPPLALGTSDISTYSHGNHEPVIHHRTMTAELDKIPSHPQSDTIRAIPSPTRTVQAFTVDVNALQVTGPVVKPASLATECCMGS